MSSSRRKQKKKVNSFDSAFNLQPIKAIKPVQQDVIDSWSEGNNLFLYGSPGTGKSFLGLGLAFDDLKNGNYNDVTIIRSVVPSRDIGFLPGTMTEKIEVYEAPYISIASELFGRSDAYKMLKEKELVKFLPSSFLRGQTFNDTILFVDEIQNFTFHELDTVITRLGKNCRVIFSGDIKQTDLNKKSDKSGFETFFYILEKMWDDSDPSVSFDMIEFTSEDIVRSGIVKNYIIAKENLDS